MNLPSWDKGAKVLGDYATLTALMNKDPYSPQDKADMLALIKQNGLAYVDKGTYLELRCLRGKFLQRHHKPKLPEVVASGRTSWVGWVELRTDPVERVATENTAQVIRDVNADIISVIEAESRRALQHFNTQYLRFVKGLGYESVMLIQGNDERGIDVGLMTRKDFEIISIGSHVNERAPSGGPLFSRDCAEYEIRTLQGLTFWLLVNHFKSKGYGDPADGDARRKAQATRVREIYEAHRQAGHERVAVLGDLNDDPSRNPLSPLLASGSDLRDVSESQSFKGDGRSYTWYDTKRSAKLDYILLSPAMFNAMKDAGVNRTGVWDGTKDGKLWKHFHMEGPQDAASDHAAVWADLQL
jgi:endonuclease/exonuclease/phosphatase family metal-dependent hydrolase